MIKMRPHEAAQIGAITLWPHGQKKHQILPPFPLPLSLSHSYKICCQVTVALQIPRCIISSQLWPERSDISATEKLWCHTHILGECRLKVCVRETPSSVHHELQIKRPLTNAAITVAHFHDTLYRKKKKKNHVKILLTVLCPSPFCDARIINISS